MKKLITALAAIVLLATTSYADIDISWTLNDPDNVATSITLLYVQDTGQTDAELINSSGFTSVPLNLADTTYRLTGLADDTDYCIYINVTSPNSSFDSDIYCLKHGAAREVIDIQSEVGCSITINVVNAPR